MVECHVEGSFRFIFTKFLRIMAMIIVILVRIYTSNSYKTPSNYILLNRVHNDENDDDMEIC